ncbi:MAG: hypothetical protein HY812_22025 [Planctomycetes bacterium]|nr:hypothetical protein [Planctomycetota bacterium]
MARPEKRDRVALLFSPAEELSINDYRRPPVSGTASHDPQGQTLHAGDAAAQIERMLVVLAALFASRGPDFCDVAGDVACFRDAEDAGAFASFLARAGSRARETLVNAGRGHPSCRRPPVGV